MSPKTIGSIVAAVILAALSLANATEAATAANKKQKAVTAYRYLYGWHPSSANGCTWPYRNQYPPCMSTWPEGDPNYHGWKR